MRPPWLTNGRHTGSYQTEMNGNVRGGFQVSRADLADCMLRCLTNQASVRTAISTASSKTNGPTAVAAGRPK
jgi:hypothetical protein